MKKNYTLIELLTIISIIAILASLLQPSLNKIVNQANLISCSKNLRVHSQAIYLYAEDFDNSINLHQVPGTISYKRMAFYNGKNWTVDFFHKGEYGYLDPYLQYTEDAYTCPGSIFQQGVKTFTVGHPDRLHNVSTYASTSSVAWMMKNLNDYKMFNHNIDLNRNYDQHTNKVLLFDPIMKYSFSSPGGAYDVTESVIHNNSGALPILTEVSSQNCAIASKATKKIIRPFIFQQLTT